jgi:molecular chaperone GrpE (heat shock protein)
MYILTGVGVSRYDDCVEYYKKFGMDNLQNRIIEVIDDLQKAFTAQAPEDEADLEAKPEHVSMWCIAVYIDV